MDRQKKVMALHDISCVGRCSLTVALPILSAAGIDTGVLPTAVLSTHTGGFTDFTYRDLTEDIVPISKHWQSLNLKFDAMYSGFLGSFEQIDLIGNLFDTFKQNNNLIMVDPVMADNGKLYSIYSQNMVEGMARLCGKADIIIPNMTEASFILGKEYKEGPYTEECIKEILYALADLGPETVVLTGVWFENQNLGAAAYSKKTNKIHYYLSKKIEGYFHGTGDVFGSALLAAILNDNTIDNALKIAVDYTCHCINLTSELKQEARYGVCFERALPKLIENLGLYN